MAKKNTIQEQPLDGTTPEETQLPESPAVKLGQQVRFVLGPSSKNAGQVRLAEVVGIRDDGGISLHVKVASRNDLCVVGKVVGIQFEKMPTIPLAVYLVDVAAADYSAEKRPGTWHTAE